MGTFNLPDIGEGIKEVKITELSVTENSSIKKDDLVMIVESEKASMEIPANFTGIINKISVENGQTLYPGDLILSYKDNKKSNLIDNKKIKNVESKSENKKNSNDNNIVKTNSIEGSFHASPSVRKLARELDCDLENIKGTGRKGRITADDIYSFTKEGQSIHISEKEVKSENIDTNFNNLSKWGVVEKNELNNIKKITAKRLLKSWNEIPHVTQFDDVDITELSKVIKTLKSINKNPKIKISYIPFYIKCVLKILKELPVFNSSLSSDKNFLLQKKYYNIGIATDTERGLVVPVIKDVDKKSIKSITQELTTIIYKAKEKRLTIDDMSGGCFTISSLGGISGKYFTPIINPPEVAILGISKFEIMPKLINNRFKARKILPISLSYDHRVIDGADAARFTKLFSEIISNPNILINE